MLQYLGDLPADVPVDDPGAPGTMDIMASLPLSLDVNTELYTCLLSNGGSAVGTIGSAPQ